MVGFQRVNPIIKQTIIKLIGGLIIVQAKTADDFLKGNRFTTACANIGQALLGKIEVLNIIEMPLQASRK